jgi:hypothetical protein
MSPRVSGNREKLYFSTRTIFQRILSLVKDCGEASSSFFFTFGDDWLGGIKINVVLHPMRDCALFRRYYT